jgi:hypothetical protein
MTRKLFGFSASSALLILTSCTNTIGVADLPAPAGPDAGTIPAEAPSSEATPQPAPQCTEDALEKAIANVEGVTQVTRIECGSGVEMPAACFEVAFKQALEHGPSSDGKTFSQRVQIVHRGCEKPTTVTDNGYALDNPILEMEPATVFETNSVFVEHRFQGKSLPSKDSRRWATLSIENGAADLHAIITAFRKLYPNQWVSSGASKGGIASVYHRFLYPDDVNGTVAYVAPASLARHDMRYQQRLLSGALPSNCASKVREFQRAALSTRRDTLVEFISKKSGLSWDSASEELELKISSFDWGFWQRGLECEEVPWPEESDAQYIGYYELRVEERGQVDSTPLSFEDIRDSYLALTYEWIWQQGFAVQVGAHVAPLIKQETLDTLRLESLWEREKPRVSLPEFDGSVTQNAAAWVASSAERLVLVYGEFDPWTGGALDTPSKPSSGRYIVPGGSHAASVEDLPTKERDQATASIASMYGVAATTVNHLVAPRVAFAHRALMQREMAQLSMSRFTVAK